VGELTKLRTNTQKIFLMVDLCSL